MEIFALISSCACKNKRTYRTCKHKCTEKARLELNSRNLGFAESLTCMMHFIRDEKRKRQRGSRDAQRVRRCVSDSLTSSICILKWSSAEEQEGGNQGSGSSRWAYIRMLVTHICMLMRACTHGSKQCDT